MDGFLTALKSDLFRAVHARGLQLLAVLPALAAFARILFGRLGTASREVQGSLAGRPLPAGSELSAYAAFVDGVSTGLTLGALMLVAVAAHSLAADRDHGVVRHLLVGRVSRGALVLARYAASLVLAAAVCAGIILTAWIGAGLFYDFTPVVEDGYELIGTAEMRGEILRGFLLAVVPLPAALAFGVLLSVATRSATQAVACALGATIAFDLFKGLLGSGAHYVYAFWLPSLADRSYLKDVAQLVRGFSDVFVEEGALRLNWLVPLPATLLFLAAAYAVCRRRKM